VPDHPRTDLNRRAFLGGVLWVCLGCARGEPGGGSAHAAGPRRVGALADLERAHGGRLGVAALDTGTSRRIEHRADERFPFCSTCKTLAVAATLRRVDLAREQLAREIAYTAADLLDNAPVTRANVARGAMTIAELCKAAIEVSDNTAANLLFREAGGLSAINDYLRSIGDSTTHMDRLELALNTAIAGDPRDTTSPRAIVGDLEKLFLGDALSPASRDQLTAWHLAASRGKARLRAGLPTTWKLGHKTGTGANGATNDIGVAWPPDRRPVLIAVYYVGGRGDGDAREAVIAAAARIIAAAL
jgi:beta-lactamase class A